MPTPYTSTHTHTYVYRELQNINDAILMNSNVLPTSYMSVSNINSMNCNYFLPNRIHSPTSGWDFATSPLAYKYGREKKNANFYTRCKNV